MRRPFGGFGQMGSGRFPWTLPSGEPGGRRGGRLDSDRRGGKPRAERKLAVSLAT